ncbi:hypothetical protein ACTHHL_00475 [Aeribacillus composti]|uniref:hypothetical protein n=1 Tax=Aeribacillus composti TaxID=1868734 RepID=UPI0028716443|nr:hypothetical protein [Aeribacillus pallidus]
MLKLISSSFEDLKKEMKLSLENVNQKIQALEKERRRAEFEDQMKELHNLKRIYSLSKVLPVRIEGIVINYKLYKAFMKKLKGFEKHTAVLWDRLEIHYREPKTKNKGSLTLLNLSSYFRDFKHIPISEMEEKEIETGASI